MTVEAFATFLNKEFIKALENDDAFFQKNMQTVLPVRGTTGKDILPAT